VRGARGNSRPYREKTQREYIFSALPESGHCAMQSACPFQSEDMRVDGRSRPSGLSKADCVQACGASHADACLNCTPRFWHDSAIVGSLRPETHTAGQPTSRGQRPGASARAFVLAAAATLTGAGANGAGMANRLRGPLWDRMSPQAAAEHLWAGLRRLRLRPRARGPGLNRRHRPLLVEGERGT
jgi:hypothetical protein